MIGEEKEGRSDAQDAARRLGWRHTPREIVGLVIAERLHCGERPDRYVRLLGALDDFRLCGHFRLPFADVIGELLMVES
jgi:hypothetical protein